MSFLENKIILLVSGVLLITYGFIAFRCPIALMKFYARSYGCEKERIEEALNYNIKSKWQIPRLRFLGVVLILVGIFFIWGYFKQRARH